MALPVPSMNFTPFDVLPASDLNNLVENIEYLEDKPVSSTMLNLTGSKTAAVATSETTSSTSYADLTTTTDSVSVVVNASGILYVSFGARISNSSGGSNSLMGVALSGAATVAANDDYSILVQSTAPLKFSETHMFTGLTPGTYTVKLKYRVSSAVGTYANRHLEAIPL